MSEHAVQVAFVQWCRLSQRKYPELKLAYAIPNGGVRNAITGARLKAEGVRKGVLDWHLATPRKGFSGLWIEFKWGKNKLTPEQKEFVAMLRAEGHFVEICYTVDEAIKQVERYLGTTIIYDTLVLEGVAA